jgi:hypothetical protein
MRPLHQAMSLFVGAPVQRKCLTGVRVTGSGRVAHNILWTAFDKEFETEAQASEYEKLYKLTNYVDNTWQAIKQEPTGGYANYADVGEEILLDFLIWIGFTNAQRTYVGKDGGVDVFVSDAMIAQCKIRSRNTSIADIENWHSKVTKHKVTGARINERVEHFFFCSTGYVSEKELSNELFQVATRLNIKLLLLVPNPTNNNNHVIPYNDSAQAFVAERRKEQRKIYAIDIVYQFMFPDLPELPEPAVFPFQRLKTRMQKLAKTENLGSDLVVPDTLVIQLSSPNSENVYVWFLTKSSGKFSFTILCQSKNHTTPLPPRVTRSSQNAPTQPSTMEYSPEPNRPYQQSVAIAPSQELLDNFGENHFKELLGYLYDVMGALPWFYAWQPEIPDVDTVASGSDDV